MKHKALQHYSFYNYSKIYIEFSISSKNDLTKIKEQLNFKPDQFYNIGDEYKGKTLNINSNKLETVINKYNQSIIKITTKNKVKSKLLEDHIEYLNKLLSKTKLKLNNYDSKIFIYCLINDIPNGIGIDTKNIMKILKFSKYFEIRNFTKEYWN